MPSPLEATVRRGFANRRCRARPRHAVRMYPARFGRGRTRLLTDAPAKEQGWTLSDDARMFATTFVSGFLFVSILIG